MSDDIVDRLRRWSHDPYGAAASDLMDEAAYEIERLRLAIRRLAEHDETLSAQGGNVSVTMDATLTAAEREAVEEVCYCLTESGTFLRNQSAVRDTLRGLLERMK